MIEGPRRSVTRFFVPLIDVLILLFCIFLLMPFVTQPASLEPSPDGKDAIDPTKEEKLPTNLVDLQNELLRLRDELKRIKELQGSLSDRLNVRVLEIDSRSGRLYYFQDSERREVRNELDAQRLIDEHQRSSTSNKKEPFFLILYPRTISGFPQQQQVDNYRRWFRSVPTGFDNPLATFNP